MLDYFRPSLTQTHNQWSCSILVLQPNRFARRKEQQQQQVATSKRLRLDSTDLFGFVLLECPSAHHIGPPSRTETDKGRFGQHLALLARRAMQNQLTV